MERGEEEEEDVAVDGVGAAAHGVCMVSIFLLVAAVASCRAKKGVAQWNSPDGSAQHGGIRSRINSSRNVREAM